MDGKGQAFPTGAARRGLTYYTITTPSLRRYYTVTTPSLHRFFIVIAAPLRLILPKQGPDGREWVADSAISPRASRILPVGSQFGLRLLQFTARGALPGRARARIGTLLVDVYPCRSAGVSTFYA